MGTARSTITWLHRYLGLSLAILLSFAGITGSLVAFQSELHAWLNRDLLALCVDAPALPLQELIARVERQRPLARVVAVPLEPLAQSGPHLLLLSVSPRTAQALPYDQIWVDAATAKLLAERKFNANVLDRRHLMSLIFRLHSSLLLGNTGNLILGSLASLWLVTTLFGLVLAWPRAGHWRTLLALQWHSHRLRFRFDLHRIIGLLSAPIFVLVSLTAVYFTLDFLHPLVNRALPSSEWPTEGLPERNFEQASLPPETALALAKAQFADAKLSGLRLDYTHGVYQVALRRPTDIGRNIENLVFVDMQQPRVVTQWTPARRQAGDEFDVWQLPLHTGQFLGLAGRILWCIAGFLPLLLVWSAVSVWWGKRKRRKT